MRHTVKQKKPKNKYMIAAAFAVLALVLVITLIAVNAFDGGGGDGETASSVPDIIDGEARQSGLTLAYPVINKQDQLSYIAVKNGNGEFGFTKLSGESFFTLYYVDDDGKPVLYYPEICSADESFVYTDLFKIETGDGYSQYTILDYLCIALQMPYFEERIPLSEDEETKKAQLAEYGLSDGKGGSVGFEYTDEFGETVYRTVRIGDKCVSGNGYYFTVDDRPYVYSSINNYYDYAVSSLTSFVKALLVSEGLSSDKGYAPYLTTGYYQWKNEMHGEEGERVTEGSRVIAYVDTVSAIDSDGSADGYDATGYKLTEIDLSKFKNNAYYSRMLTALSGARVGVQSGDIVFTVSSPSRLIDFGSADSVRYEYEISAVEAILTDSGEITAEGTRIGEHNIIKVTYTVSQNGKSQASNPLHAVIDLTSSGIPDAARAELRVASVGTLSKSVSFAVDYTPENAQVRKSRYIITQIIAIYDAEGKETEKITSDSIVSYRYSVEIDGNNAGEATYVLDLSKITEGADLEIKNALLGKGVSQNLSLEFEEYSSYYEYFERFTTYKIARIDYFVKSELITAFKFQNSSERDPYYGESLYENLMEDSHKLYGLNSSACESVVKMLGGLSNDSSTSAAAGLYGDSVVAVGLTPDVMKKYGLYAYTVYFELPRGIVAYEPEGSGDDSLSEVLDDYTFHDTLGFYLYISEVDPVTNTRYIASDLYDIVTSLPADDFVFLNYDFETYWARRNIILMDINDIEGVGISFNMSDVKGEYYFDLIHTQSTYVSGNTEATYNKITVFVTPEGECDTNKLLEYMAEKGYADGVSLSELYNYLYPNDSELKSVYPDSLGTAYFRKLIRMIYLMSYVDVMPESEREAAKQPDKLVMRMSLDIKSSAYSYVYEFYRADDRRVLVSIHQEDANGKVVTTPISDFYVSTFTMKKTVTNFFGILNGEKIDTDIGYTAE